LRYLVRDQEVEGSNPFAPTTKTLSLTDLRICRASVLHEIRSARSAINVRGRLSLRKVEAESHFLSPLLSVLYVFDYLSPVACAHVRVLMSHPIVNQDLAAFRPEQHRFPKSAESIEGNASSSHPLEDCRQTITKKLSGESESVLNGGRPAGSKGREIWRRRWDWSPASLRNFHQY
jgi:hypothetical protein